MRDTEGSARPSPWHTGTFPAETTSEIYCLLFWHQNGRCCQPYLQGYCTFLHITCSFHSKSSFLITIQWSRLFLVTDWLWGCTGIFLIYGGKAISSHVVSEACQPFWRKMRPVEERNTKAHSGAEFETLRSRRSISLNKKLIALMAPYGRHHILGGAERICDR